MDILAILRANVASLREGSHSRGLNAVLAHLEVAYRHLSRGQLDKDDSAYTDAIYRCNQAFEGSLKEAYRVLASKDPSKSNPYQIETHLEENSVLPTRVLGLFKNYRQEWRNPSTHDYTLDFNESECFLAIVSVTAFAKLLIDQINQQVAKDSTLNLKSKLVKLIDKKSEYLDPADRVGYVISTILNSDHGKSIKDSSSESEALGFLAGLIKIAIPSSEVEISPRIESDRRYRPDLIISIGEIRIVVEIKMGHSEDTLTRGLDQIESYTKVLGTEHGVLVILSKIKHQKYLLFPFDSTVVMPELSPYQDFDWMAELEDINPEKQ